MRTSFLAGAVGIGATAAAALAIAVPAVLTRKDPAVRDDHLHGRKLDKRSMDRDAFNPKKRDVAGNQGEPDGEGEATDTGVSPTIGAEEKAARLR